MVEKRSKLLPMKLWMTLIGLIMTVNLALASEWQQIDYLVKKGIQDKIFPHAQLLVGTKDKILFEASYSDYDLFDVASLTKVLATTTSVMILVDEGKISLTDKVVRYFPSFQGKDKDGVAIEDLLRHKSGFPSGAQPKTNEVLADYLVRITTAPLRYVPGEETVYSDLNFILLSAIVEQVSGEAVDDFAFKRIFRPLKMNETYFHVPKKFKCAPTEPDRDCTPHDPTAFHFFPKSVGHAGVFSNVKNISRLAQMMLNGGELEGVRILKSETVKLMTTLPKGEIRGLGWDLLSEYASTPRGEIFPKGISYGHTGYTGTTLWLDPQSQSYIIFLGNRVANGDEETKKAFGLFRKNLSTEVARLIYK